MSHTLAVVTVVYNNYSVLEDFIASLQKQQNKNFHLFIADLSTTRKDIHIPNITYDVIYGENQGYAHGVNVGLYAAQKKGLHLFCVINNDTFFKSDFTENAVQSLINHPDSLIGAKIYYAKGFEYHKEKYTPQDLGHVIWYAGGIVDWDHVITYHRGVDERDSNIFNTFEKTEFVTGCCMLFDQKVLDTVGPWDETYFLYYEDADYCERAKQKNIALYYDPSIRLWHKNAQSTDGSGSSLHQKYQTNNRVKFALKYAPLRTKFHVVKNHFLTLLKK